MFLPHTRMKVSIVGSLRDREVACSASDRQGSNFESCVWRTVSSQSSHQPQEVLLAQFSLYVHKGGLKPDSFHFFCFEDSCVFYEYPARAILPCKGKRQYLLTLQTSCWLYRAATQQTRHKVVLMLGQRRRQWTSIKPTLFSGIDRHQIQHLM